MDYNYSYDVNDGALGALLAVYVIIVLAVYVVTVIGLWKMFVKAGRPGWAAIIPFYNWWVWVEMIGRPRWWFWALEKSAHRPIRRWASESWRGFSIQSRLRWWGPQTPSANGGSAFRPTSSPGGSRGRYTS